MASRASLDRPTLRTLPTWIFKGQPAVWALSAFLLLVDAVLIAVHVWADTKGMGNPLLYIDKDRGYAEFFQAMKYAYAAVLLVSHCAARREWYLLMWATLLCYFLIDDLFMVHEIKGGIVASRLGLRPTLGLRAQDLGELIVTAAVALVMGVPILVAYLKGSPGIRWACRILAGLVAALAMFGVVIDMAHIVMLPSLAGFDWVALLEDGGEMLVISLLLVFVFRLALIQEHAPKPATP